MKEYKLSAQSVEQMEAFLSANFNFEFKGSSSMLNLTDAFVFVNGNGKIPNETNPETGEVISWLDGYHANLLVPIDFDDTILNCVIPEPENPKYEFT